MVRGYMNKRPYNPSIIICTNCPLNPATCNTVAHGPYQARQLENEPSCLLNFAWYHRLPTTEAAQIARETLARGLPVRYYYARVKRDGNRLQIRQMIEQTGQQVSV